MIYHGINIEPISGEATRFLAGASKGEAYLVDIISYSGNGKCSCPHFEFRLEPKVKTGEIHRCKHILASREMALDIIIHAEINSLKKTLQR